MTVGTGDAIVPQDRLERRLATLRAARAARLGAGFPAWSAEGSAGGPSQRLPTASLVGPALPGGPSAALAAAVGGQLVATATGAYVQVAGAASSIAIDRAALARLPGLPPPHAPLVCLDTETTGLATAAGTVAFLVGFGIWRADRFEQVQLLLPDHPDEPALLDAIAALIPADSWLVTYNGRAFDWPLLVARYRLARRGPPAHAGHLDLLSFVRRVYRHRLPDARLRTVEREILRLGRGEDVEGWEIPARYLSFLRGGRAEPLAVVVRHNAADVRSLARLLALVATTLGDPGGRAAADPGDLAALADACARAGRHETALDCLEAALASPHWSIEAAGAAVPGKAEARRARRDGLAVARARTLDRLGRREEGLVAWRSIAEAGGPFAGVAWVEVAKSLEHRRRDPEAALAAAQRALGIAERARLLDRPLPRLEQDLAHRLRRLRRRVARRSAGRHAPRGGPQDGRTARSPGAATA